MLQLITCPKHRKVLVANIYQHSMCQELERYYTSTVNSEQKFAVDFLFQAQSSATS